MMPRRLNRDCSSLKRLRLKVEMWSHQHVGNVLSHETREVKSL